MKASEILNHQGPRSKADSDILVKVYDFKRPDKFSKEQIRTISIVHETGSRYLTARLSAMLRMEVEIHVCAVDQMTFQEYMNSVGKGPSFFGMYKGFSKKMKTVLHIDTPIVLMMLDRMFGGTGINEEKPRDCSKLEEPLVHVIYNQIGKGLETGWSPVVDFKPTLEWFETNKIFVQCVAPEEMIVLVTYEVLIGGETHHMNLLFPYLVLEPYLERLSAQFFYFGMIKGEGENLRRSKIIDDTNLPVTMEVLFPLEKMDIRKLQSLKKGDKFALSVPETPLIIRGGGSELLKLNSLGFPGATEYTILETPESNGTTIANTEKQLNKITEINSMVEKKLDAGMEKLKQLITAPSTEKEYEEPEDLKTLSIESSQDILTALTWGSSQLKACVVSLLNTETAASLLDKFEEDEKVRVLERLAMLDYVSPRVKDSLAKALFDFMDLKDGSEREQTGGVEKAADILNFSSRQSEAYIMQELEKRNHPLAEQLKKAIFTFQDLLILSEEAFDQLMENTDVKLMASALRDTPSAFQQSILDRVTESVRQDISVELDQKIPPSADILAAREEIVHKLMELEAQGAVYIPRPGDNLNH